MIEIWLGNSAWVNSLTGLECTRFGGSKGAIMRFKIGIKATTGKKSCVLFGLSVQFIVWAGSGKRFTRSGN